MDKKKKNCGIATIYTVEYYLARRNGLYFTVWMNCKNNTEWKKSHTKFGSIYYAYNRKNQPTVTESRLVVTWGSGFRVLSIMGHERWGGSQKVNKSVKSHWNWSTSSRCFFFGKWSITLHESQSCHGEGACKLNKAMSHATQGHPRQVIARVLTKRGPSDEEMATYFSILAARTPWRVWKG